MSSVALQGREHAKPGLVPIASDMVHFTNEVDRTVVGYVDFVGPRPSNRPIIIMPPGFGQTKADVVPLAYPLARLGFAVLRYDRTDHVGESEGEILNSSVASMEHDLKGAIKFARKTLHATKIAVAAYSLEFRNALRIAADGAQIDFLCSILGMVDLRSALQAIYAQDIIALYNMGVRWGTTDLLGFKVNADNFLSSAITTSLHSLRSSIRDAEKIAIPVLFIVGEKDLLTTHTAIEEVFRAIPSPHKEIRLLPDAMHVYGESKDSLCDVNEALGYGALKYLNGEVHHHYELDLCAKEVNERIAWERKRFRELRHVDRREEQEFWSTYLKDFRRVVNLPDYWSLLELIHDTWGGISAGERVLDAGSGTGNFGSYLIVKYLYRVVSSAVNHATRPLFHYMGVDFVRSSLLEARNAHLALQKNCAEQVGLIKSKPFISCDFVEADLANPLSFRDQSFDKICCNLVLSYVPDDQFTLKELWRMLKPGGKIVITTLKPHADLSEVYRNFLKMADTDKEIEDARFLLANAAMIKAREAEGLYRFYDPEELESKLLAIGAVRLRILSAFSNQVVAGFAEKA